MCLGVVVVMCCAMVHNVWLCVLCVRVGVSFNVFVCGVGGVLYHVFVGVACDVLCGDVWFGVVCGLCLCVCSLFKNVCCL